MTRATGALLFTLALSACRSYSPAAIQELYTEELKWDGRDDALLARKPSAEHWERVERQQHLTLADAFRISLTQSERVARAAESFLQSMTFRDRALGAFLPTIGLQATQFVQNDFSGALAPSDHGEVRATFSQPLFRGLRDFAAWRATAGTIEQRRSAFDTERRLLFQIVAQTFYNTLFLERQVKILEDSLKNTRDRLREMQARRDQGIARKTEVLLIETQLASDESQLTRAKVAWDLSKFQLGFLLGRPIQVPLRDDVEFTAVPQDAGPLVQEAHDQRSDLKERALAVQVAEENIRVISGEHLPSLDLTANYYLFRENFTSSQQATDWDLLFTLTFNVFKGGDIRGRTIEAESQYRVAVLNHQELRRQIETDVASALANLRADDELIKTLETRERTAGENYNQVVTEYRQGLAGVTNLEVLVAQNQFLSAQLELDRQRFQRKLDWFQLQNVLGKIPVR